MARKLLLFYFLTLCAYGTVAAFTIKGTVTSSTGEKLGYSNIYIKGTTNGTSANGEGQYLLELPPGKYEVIYQHMGFKQHIEIVDLNSDKNIDVTLQVAEYKFSDVEVNGNEDPAYRIIRKAIERRKYFLNAVDNYSCDAYVKGMQRVLEAPDKIMGRSLKTIPELNGPKNSGILYLSESLSKLYYKKPNKFKEVVYSSKVSGKANGFTWNSAQDFFFNFYERSITIPFIAPRPFISPLSENAFFYYKFKMLGSYFEDGRLVSKIEVTPKRPADPVFSGYITIVEDNWNIHSLELYLTKRNGIEYVDTLKVTQYFIPVKEEIWMPSQQRYDVKASFMGVKGDGYYLGVFKNYKVNGIFENVVPNTKSTDPEKVAQAIKRAEKKEEKKLFTAEIIKVEEDANKRDTMYWDSIRPIPLTEIELADYTFKDSLETIRDTKAYKDSTDKKRNVPGFLSIFGGFTFEKRSKKITVQIPSLLSYVNFNTVEGIALEFKLKFVKEFEKRNAFTFEPWFRYGITNRQFNARLGVGYRISQKRDETITLAGGRYVSQFNEVQPQPYIGNTTQSLIFKLNFMKLYQQYYVKLSYQREIYNGIKGFITLNYAQRYPLQNTNLFSIFNKIRTQYTPNGMDLPGSVGIRDNISRHDVFTVDLKFRFRFNQQYITRPDLRIRTNDDKIPELTIHYRKAFEIKNFSDLNFDFLEGSLEGTIPMKLVGQSFYRIGGGGFINNKKVDYDEYKHFYGNFMTQGNTDLMGFYLIRYYHFSTKRYFAEAHIEHHFNGFFFNKIPGFRKLKLREVVGGHFLYTDTRKQYFQLDVGIENILKIIRVDFVAGFGGQLYTYFGGRIGLAITAFNN
jgi:hypothetical protein